MHPNLKMQDAVTPIVVGGSGILATFAVGEFNQYVAASIGIVSFIAIIPVALSRWKKYLSGKPVETNPPIP